MANVLSQALLKRHPNFTRREFSEAWERHGRIVAPYLIKYGIVYYAQVHDIQLAQSSNSQNDSIRIEEWDGAAEMVFTATEEQKAEWQKNDPAYDGYYENVILADERRFLASEAKLHVKRVEPGTVEGRRVVIIENGQALVSIPDEIMEEWRKWDKK